MHSDIARQRRLAAKIAAKNEVRLYFAAASLATVAFIIRFGDPQIGEPLSRACGRVENSEAWKECCAMSPGLPSWRGKFRPYSSSVAGLSTRLRHGLIRLFPGRSERDKLNRVIEQAPPWLLWFTFSDYTASELGLRVPDLTAVSCFERVRTIGCIPEGAFRRRYWDDGIVKEPPTRPKVFDRARWPRLFSMEVSELTPKEWYEVEDSPNPLRKALDRKYPDSDVEIFSR
jgi:hypothetical protein